MVALAGLAVLLLLLFIDALNFMTLTAAMIALLEVLELDRAWFELCDRGLLDFTAWMAGQTVDEEEMKNFDVQMLAASTVPAPAASMMLLDTPETIGAAQNFFLICALTYHR